MATQTIRDQKVWFGGYDMTGKLNSVALEYGAEMKDDTTLGDDTRSMKAGLKTVTLQINGFFEATPTDKALFDAMGLTDVPVTIGTSGSLGAVAYFFKAALADYAPSGAVGDMFGFQAGCRPTKADLIRGYILEYDSSVTANYDGTSLTLPAVGSSQYLHAALHVFSASGTTPTLDVEIESDANTGYGSPITRVTFAQMTDIGSQYLTAAGPITDTEYRVSVSVGGTNPDFGYAVVIGIL